jgi:hypothetical protein
VTIRMNWLHLTSTLRGSLVESDRQETGRSCMGRNEQVNAAQNALIQ